MQFLQSHRNTAKRTTAIFESAPRSATTTSSSSTVSATNTQSHHFHSSFLRLHNNDFTSTFLSHQNPSLPRRFTPGNTLRTNPAPPPYSQDHHDRIKFWGNSLEVSEPFLLFDRMHWFVGESCWTFHFDANVGLKLKIEKKRKEKKAWRVQKWPSQHRRVTKKRVTHSDELTRWEVLGLFPLIFASL
jgi:hypothetical protein